MIHPSSLLMLRTSQHATDSQAETILACCDKEYKLSLSRLKGLRLPQRIADVNLRYFLYRKGKHILGWGECRIEGDSNESFDEVNQVFREELWLDKVVSESAIVEEETTSNTKFGKTTHGV